MKIDFDHEATGLSFSTHYQNICAVSTMELNNWYHNGSIYIIDSVESKIIQKIENQIGVHQICWSECYHDLLLSANHDGTFNLWNINNKKKSQVVAEEGYHLSSIDWNNLQKELILVGSESSRIQLFDGSNFNKIRNTFAEHTKFISDVKWNPNNEFEFASSSQDALLKIWDLRSEYSVNTLLDKKDPCSLRGIDWHKRDDWVIAVGTVNDKILIWDVRNPLQPVKIQKAHKFVKSVKFDTIFPDRLSSCGKDQTVRVWDTRIGIDLIFEHKIHRDSVNSVDWNIHDSFRIFSVGNDKQLIGKDIKVAQHSKL